MSYYRRRAWWNGDYSRPRYHPYSSTTPSTTGARGGRYYTVSDIEPYSLPSEQLRPTSVGVGQLAISERLSRLESALTRLGQVVITTTTSSPDALNPDSSKVASSESRPPLPTSQPSSTALSTTLGSTERLGTGSSVRSIRGGSDGEPEPSDAESLGEEDTSDGGTGSDAEDDSIVVSDEAPEDPYASDGEHSEVEAASYTAAEFVRAFSQFLKNGKAVPSAPVRSPRSDAAQNGSNEAPAADGEHGHRVSKQADDEDGSVRHVVHSRDKRRRKSGMVRRSKRELQ